MVETEARRGDVVVEDFSNGVFLGVVKFRMAVGLVLKLVSVFRFFLFS